jgi:small subunit ribosomal protein S11
MSQDEKDLTTAPAAEAAPAPAAAEQAAPKKEKAAAQPKTEAAPEAVPEKKEITAKDLLSEGLEEVKIRKAKGSKNITNGVCHILATFNNTKVTFTDQSGNVISWATAGKNNFRGSRKSTAYAAQVVCQDAGRVAMSHGLKEVFVKVKGPGMGRDSAIRALQNLGLTVSGIVDATPIPHNGCRPPKRRRV